MTLTVWGMDVHLRKVRGQQRAVIASRSKAAAARALDVSIGHFNMYAADTGNEEEIRVALAEPGVVFHRGLDDRDAEWEALR